MHIHTDSFSELKRCIERDFPTHTVAFDVVFETPSDTFVDWHCDFESLGPFSYDSKESLEKHHFLSIHFNLTPNGGALTTLPWTRLSCIHHWVISTFGLYSIPHNILNTLCRPVFQSFAWMHSNAANRGNVFDNMHLHAVQKGDARVSYVIRLVQKGKSVRTCPYTILKSALSTPASEFLRNVLLPHVPCSMNASDVPWESVSKGASFREEKVFFQ